MLEFLLEQAEYAHWYIFILFLLAGLNVPMSEDVLMIGSAVLAAAIVPENFPYLLACAFLGAYLSDLESYWLARLVGPRLLRFKLVAKTLPPERVELIRGFMNKYGPYTLLVGRFIPFGVRNGMFMTAGLSRMTFWKFALFDFFACVMTTSVLFGLGYSFGKNYKKLFELLGVWKFYIFIGFLTVLSAVYITYRFRQAKRREKENSFSSGNSGQAS